MTHEHPTQFVDAQERAKQFPSTFEAPTAADLAQVEPGASVKVCANDTERFWVSVTSVEGEAVTGAVDNDLVCTDEHGLRYGDTITFEKRHIFSTHVPT
jgi:hypothetical protein